jgi:hypothetical protein
MGPGIHRRSRRYEFTAVVQRPSVLIHSLDPT